MAWTGWNNNPFWRPPNLYGGRNPVTGDRQDWYDTPVSKGLDLHRGEIERFLTEQGYGGFGNRENLMRGIVAQRAEPGYEAAVLTNPNLAFRDYLNTLEGDWMNQIYAGLTPEQRGSFIPGQTRWIRRG